MLAERSKSTAPVLTLLPGDAAPPVPEGYPLHDLDDTRLAAVARLRTALSSRLATDPEAHEREQKWADDACLVRFLRATKWNYESALTRLAATLQWRREYRPDCISPEEVAAECETGKEFVFGFDRSYRPVLYLIPARENTKTYDRQLRFVVFNLERLTRIMPPGVDSITVVVDYENLSMSTAPPLSVSRKFLQIIGDYYPERLGSCFVVNPSWYLWVFFRLIGPLMDPVTRAKIHFVDLKKMAQAQKESGSNEAPKSAPAAEGTNGWTDLRNHIEPKYLLAQFGGEFEYEWDFKTYWNALCSV